MGTLGFEIVSLKKRIKAVRQQTRLVRHLSVVGLASFIVLVGWLTVATAALASPIAYNEPGIFPLPTGSWDVWLINPDQSGNHRIPVPGELLSAAQPVWSRDGQRIAATGFVCRGVECVESSVVFDPAGDHVLLVPSKQFPFLIFKAFSPDRTKLAFVLRHLNFAIFGTVDLTGPTESFLPRIDRLVNPQIVELGSRDDATDGGASGIGIDWSPTQNILVTSLCSWNLLPPAEICRLYLVQPVQGGLNNPFPLTSPVPDSDTFQISDVRPTFSPDGRQVAFVRQTNRAFGPSTTALWITNGANERKLIELPVQVDMPVSWSPDSRQLIFGVIDKWGQNFGLYTINVDGTNLQSFLPSPAQEPSWSAAP